jgi:hypothetical protein
MNYLFPYDNIVIGILILIVGFGFHWLGQLVSVLNWQLATRMGLQEKGMPREFKVYEHAIAITDALMGWIYGLAAVGLLLKVSWGYKLAWFPAIVFIYHSLSFWFWTGNQRRAGHKLASNTTRILWTLLNFTTGILAILLAWKAT